MGLVFYKSTKSRSCLSIWLYGYNEEQRPLGDHGDYGESGESGDDDDNCDGHVG